MNVKNLAELARNQLADVTGLKPVTVTGTFKDDQGWHVGVEMLEMARIPCATDVLGHYDVLLDDAGNMIKFERTRTRLRCDPVEEKATA